MLQRLLGIAVLVAGLSATTGCATTSAARPATGAQAPRRSVRGEEFRVVGPGASEGDAYDATLLFDRATQQLRAGQVEGALADYERLVREFPTNRVVAAAQYNRALCLQRLGRTPEAAEATRGAIAASREDDLTRDALFRLAVLGEAAQQPAWVVEGTTGLLARPRLTLTDRVEALARRSAAVLAQGDRAEAARLAQQAVEVAPSEEAVRALDDDTYAAQARFLLGEVTRLTAEDVAYRVEAPDVEEAITRRVNLVTRAHVQFNDAIRVQHPHWAAAAGFRIGQMYRDLYRAIVDAPLPEDWDENARGIYRRRTSERLRPLLQGAIRSWEATISMARRNGIRDNDWVRQADEALESLLGLIRGDAPNAPTRNQNTRNPAPQTAPTAVRPAA